jgi:EmrB/QacA subfamily drug resistance transporter
MCLSLFLAMLNNTVINVALPTISRDLGVGVSGLQWILDAYVLAFASLMLTGGVLGDRFGRKRTFVIGLALFTVASTGCALSTSVGQLLAGRAFQGVGAALLLPGSLSIITVTFEPGERARAIGIWAGVSGLAACLGPTIGGFMVEHVGWQSIFFLGVPVGLVGLVAAIRFVPESRSEIARRVDGTGLALGTIALFLATYGLIEANQKGWGDPVIIASLSGAVVCSAAFVAWERRAPWPMLPLRFFRIPAFAAGNIVGFTLSLGMFGFFFFLSLYMQSIHGYSPFETGLLFLPMTGMFVATSPFGGRLAQSRGPRLPMVVGLFLCAAAFLVLSMIGPSAPYLVLAPTFAAIGLANGLIIAPVTFVVMDAVGPERSGMGSAATNTSREVGGVFGIAFLGTLLTVGLKASLAPGLERLGLPPGRLEAILAEGGHGRLEPATLAGLSPGQAAAVRAAFRSAFMDGFHLAHVVPAVLLIATAFVALAMIPGRARPAAPLPGDLASEVVAAALASGSDADAPVVIPSEPAPVPAGGAGAQTPLPRTPGRPAG